jgi:predicted nucleic acid-binding Zn ribbon protein
LVSGSAWRRPVRISEALSATFRRLGLEERIRQHEIWGVWSAVVGPQIAQHAQPHSIWQGRLIVHVSDPVWLHHLSMMRHKVVPALNVRLEVSVVREMILRVGEVPAVPPAVSTGSPRTEYMAPLDPAEATRVEALLAPLGDAPFCDALRRLLLRASRRSSRNLTK